MHLESLSGQNDWSQYVLYSGGSTVHELFMSLTSLYAWVGICLQSKKQAQWLRQTTRSIWKGLTFTCMCTSYFFLELVQQKLQGGFEMLNPRINLLFVKHAGIHKNYNDRCHAPFHSSRLAELEANIQMWFQLNVAIQWKFGNTC